MSQRFHQSNPMGFPNGYNERSLMMKQGDNWINQGDNSFRTQGFEQVEAPPQVYDAGGPMSAAANDIVLNDQIQSSFRWPQKPQLPVAVSLQENSKIATEDGLQLMQSHVMKPSSSSTSSLHHLQGYHLVSSGLTTMDPPNSQFTWTRNNSQSSNSVYGQGLSLSLSSSLTDLEVTKFQEWRTGDGNGVYFFDPGLGSTMNLFGYKNLEINQPSLGLTDQTSQIHLGLPTSSRMMNNTLYLKATQELLEEFCCVGRGYFRNPRVKNGSPKSGNGGGGPAPSTTSKERPPLSAAERTEYQRRKAKLLSMLDEVDARYTHYCEQMQGVVNSFDTVMGHGSAAPYTILAQKAMSKHFRNIKDAIVAQVKLTCELLGDKDVTGTIGLTKGETPRLKMLEQKFRQQKSINQLGFLDPDAWRPQRGLPERSVNILRSWLFDHFLNPYPSEADKHLLARQTGLSKNQVSNWFINARVRLWKPMVEEIYKEEAKDEEQEETRTQDNPQNKSKVDHQNIVPSAQKSMQNCSKMNSSSREKTTTTTVEINAEEKDPSKNIIINYGQYSLGNEAVVQNHGKTSTTTSRNNSNMISIPTPPHHQRNDDSFAVYGCFTAIPSPETAMHSRNLDHDRDEYGTNIIDQSQAGDPVSLTLGLHRSDFSIHKMYYQ